jgi:hypothetical protein
MADDDTAEKQLDQRDKAWEVPSEITVELKVPLKKAASSETLERLSFKPPNFLQLRQMHERGDKQGHLIGFAYLMVMLSNDGLTMPDVERINALDFQLCQEALLPFVVLEPKATSKT